jgi:hypothetical protein
MSKDFDIHEWRLNQAQLNLLNEEEEDDFNITTDSFDVVELGIGDIITPDMWDRSSENNFFLDEPVKITDWEEEDGQIYFYVKNQSVDNIFAVDLHQYLKPKYQVVLPLYEQDDDFNITTDAFDVTELGVGDKISPKMWKENNGWYGSWAFIKNIRYSSRDNSFIVSFIDLGDYRQYDWNVSALNDKIKPQFQIVPPLNEQEDDDFNLDLGDNWNEYDGDVNIKAVVDIIWEDYDGNNLEEKWNLNETINISELQEYSDHWRPFSGELTDDNLHKWVEEVGVNLFDFGFDNFAFDVVEINRDPEFEDKDEVIDSKLKFKISAVGLNEQDEDDDFNLDLGDNWSVDVELGVGDKITPDMFKSPKDSYNFEIISFQPNNKVYLRSLKKGWEDIFRISGINELLKPEYQIVPPLNESDEDDDFNIEVGDKWNLSSKEDEILKYYKGEWEKIGNSLVIKGSLLLNYTPITSLPDNLKVEGFLLLWNTKVTSLPNNLKVGGDLDLEGTKITSLPNNLQVGGNLNLHYTPITSLPDDLKVGGNIMGFKPSLNEQDSDEDDDFNITLGKEWEFEELGIGDTITHEMWKDPEWNYFTKRGNVKITDIGDEDGVKYVILTDFKEEDNWEEYDLNYINNMLKYPYQIVQPLTEQEDNDWDLEVGDNWDEKELKVGDYWFDSSVPGWTGVWSDYKDVPNVLKNSVLKITYIGPYKPELKKPHYYDKNVVAMERGDEKYVFAIDYFNSEYGPKLNAYIPTDNLNESDDDWDLEVGEEWNDSELSVGDVITPSMWQDNVGEYWKEITDGDQEIIGFDSDYEGPYVKLRGIRIIGVDLEEINEDLLKPQYRIIQPVNEQEDDFDIEVGDKWNVKTITTGNTFKIGNNVYRLGEFSEGGKRVDVFKDDLSKPLNTTVKLIQSKLGDEYEITPPLTEQEDDFDIEVSDKWNEIELSIGDTITLDIWKDPYKTGGLPRSNWKIVAIDSEWDDIELENENKGNGTQGYITWSISSIQNLLKPEYKIVEDKELLEQEDDEWDIEVGSNWNEFEGEFILTYKVEDEGYVYVQDDIKEFQRLNPGIDEFNYEEEPIRINTTYKSRPVNMKYFISNYEDNTGHTLLPYTEEPTTEGFKKWLKDNNWDNEEFIFLYDIFYPSVIKEEYYDYRKNPVKITNKMKERRGWLDDVSGVEVLNVKFLG